GQCYGCSNTGVIEVGAIDAHQLRESELAGAVTCRYSLDPPFVAEPHHHVGHLLIGGVDEMEAAQHAVDARLDLDRSFQDLFDPRMRAADEEDAAFGSLEQQGDLAHIASPRRLRSSPEQDHARQYLFGFADLEEMRAVPRRIRTVLVWRLSAEISQVAGG